MLFHASSSIIIIDDDIVCEKEKTIVSLKAITRYQIVNQAGVVVASRACPLYLWILVKDQRRVIVVLIILTVISLILSHQNPTVVLLKALVSWSFFVFVLLHFIAIVKLVIRISSLVFLVTVKYQSQRIVCSSILLNKTLSFILASSVTKVEICTGILLVVMVLLITLVYTVRSKSYLQVLLIINMMLLMTMKRLLKEPIPRIKSLLMRIQLRSRHDEISIKKAARSLIRFI